MTDLPTLTHPPIHSLPPSLPPSLPSALMTVWQSDNWLVNYPLILFGRLVVVVVLFLLLFWGGEGSGLDNQWAIINQAINSLTNYGTSIICWHYHIINRGWNRSGQTWWPCLNRERRTLTMLNRSRNSTGNGHNLDVQFFFLCPKPTLQAYTWIILWAPQLEATGICLCPL